MASHSGQFKNLERATARLAIVVPITLLLIFVLLYMTFHAVRPAILIYLNVPFAVIGGVFALASRGMPLRATRILDRMSAQPIGRAAL